MSFNRISDAKLAEWSKDYFSVTSKIDPSNIHYYFMPGALSIIANGEKPENIPIAAEYMDEICEIWQMYKDKAVGKWSSSQSQENQRVKRGREQPSSEHIPQKIQSFMKTG